MHSLGSSRPHHASIRSLSELTSLITTTAAPSGGAGNEDGEKAVLLLANGLFSDRSTTLKPEYSTKMNQLFQVWMVKEKFSQWLSSLTPMPHPGSCPEY